MPQCDPREGGGPKARKLLNRPALRGGVIWPGAHLTPGLYPAQKSNVCIALQSPPALPFWAGGKRPRQRAKTADRHNWATRARHRVSSPRWGWDAARSPGGPQTPSNGPTRGKQRGGHPADAERPLGLPWAEGYIAGSAGGEGSLPAPTSSSLPPGSESRISASSARSPAASLAILGCQRQSEIVRKRRRNFVVFRQKGGGNKIKRFLGQIGCLQFAVSGA